MPRDTVVLQQAWSFACPACSHRTFGECVVAEATDEQMEAWAKQSYGLEPWQELPEGWGGNFVMMPEAVTCAKCGDTFDVDNGDDDAP